MIDTISGPWAGDFSPLGKTATLRAGHTRYHVLLPRAFATDSGRSLKGAASGRKQFLRNGLVGFYPDSGLNDETRTRPVEPCWVRGGPLRHQLSGRNPVNKRAQT